MFGCCLRLVLCVLKKTHSIPLSRTCPSSSITIISRCLGQAHKLSSWSMAVSTESVDLLVERAATMAAQSPRILITLAGVPGAGKSTIGQLVADGLSRRGVPSVMVGMDGFHYTRAELASRIGPEKAAKFRGAPYTFDASGVVALAKQLAAPVCEVRFATFDHAIKDPVPDGASVSAAARVVILEGNYVQLRDPVWTEIGKYAADTWFVSVDESVARERLAKRHVASGIVASLEAGRERADSNDLVNGRYIVEHSEPAAITIENN